MSDSKHPKQWLEKVPAIVFASLAPGLLRVHLHPGNGLAGGGAPVDIEVDAVPPELRMPNTLLWVRLGASMEVLEVWRRDE